MKTTLVIMAAGIGSRFGGGIKQLAPVGLNGEIIMPKFSVRDMFVKQVDREIKEFFKKIRTKCPLER